MQNHNYSDIEEQFNVVFRQNPLIQFVSLSIGSKFNHAKVQLNTNGNMSYTNSDIQMIPMFMRHINIDRQEPIDTLMIIWDIFKTEEHFMANRRILDQIRREYPNTHYILLNKICIKEDLDRVIPFLTQKMIDYQIPPANFMIANYVRFKNTPNTLERISEMVIPNTVQEILNQEEFSAYANCFYQWFGYNQYLYNFIYRYKLLHNTPTLLYNINAIERIVASQSENTIVVQDQYMIHIMENMFDLSKTCRLPHEPAGRTDTIDYYIMSLFESLDNANRIMIP